MKWLIKRIFCKHEYKTITNIYGDLINMLNCRSISICNNCGKVRRNNYLDKSCSETNLVKEIF